MSWALRILVGSKRTGERADQVRLFMPLVWLMSGLLMGSASVAEFAQPGDLAEVRNVVLVTADDLGMHLGVYGDANARTPRLDRFALEGIRFTQFHVTQSSCSPSRSSLLTGMYPHQSGQVGLSNRGYRMGEGVETLPGLLRERGYRTGIIGKLHVEPAAAFAFDYRRTEVEATRRRSEVNGNIREFLDGVGGERFFLMVNYFDPHVPFVRQVEGLPQRIREPAEVMPFGFQAGLDTAELRQRIADYYSCVDRLDSLFGDLLDELARRGLDAETVVIFLSDNGPPFNLAKASERDAGVRVPLIIRWPGVSVAGLQTAALASGVDIFATVLDAAGIAADERLPARTLRPLLAGHVPTDWRETIYTQFSSHQADRFYPMRGVSDGRYRLVRNFIAPRPNPITVDGDPSLTIAAAEYGEGTLVHSVFQRYLNPPRWELYDLLTDPHGLHDLSGAAALAGRRAILETALQRWMEELQDPVRDPATLQRWIDAHKENDSPQWSGQLPH